MTDQVSESIVRPAAVAGLFYPGNPAQLRAMVAALLAGSKGHSRLPKAVIVPHAGYEYSGPIAASVYSAFGTAARSLRRVVLLGPSHRHWFRGLSVPDATAFATPIGLVQVDQAAMGQLLRKHLVTVSNAAHALEHSLEVQLPFLQCIVPDAEIVPVLTGDATVAEVAAVIATLWGDSETLIVVSSDLSHYHAYATARRMDAETARAIVEGREDLSGEQACGCVAINGFAHVMRRYDLRPEVLDLRNSGDTAGDRSRVVGYGGFGFYDA